MAKRSDRELRVNTVPNYLPYSTSNKWFSTPAEGGIKQVLQTFVVPPQKNFLRELHFYFYSQLDENLPMLQFYARIYGWPADVNTGTPPTFASLGAPVWSSAGPITAVSNGQVDSPLVNPTTLIASNSGLALTPGNYAFCMDWEGLAQPAGAGGRQAYIPDSTAYDGGRVYRRTTGDLLVGGGSASTWDLPMVFALGEAPA
jgi:hypothetical protein